VADRIDLLLVVGSQNSSNSRRLTEVALARGIEAHLIDHAGEIDPGWLHGKQCVGVTSGASAPEELVNGVLDWLRARGVGAVVEHDAPDEAVVFRMPPLIDLTRGGAPR
jgi:4-hydroxy-3-methylbut-2-enyl diphosphate reductase